MGIARGGSRLWPLTARPPTPTSFFLHPPLTTLRFCLQPRCTVFSALLVPLPNAVHANTPAPQQASALEQVPADVGRCSATWKCSERPWLVTGGSLSHEDPRILGVTVPLRPYDSPFWQRYMYSTPTNWLPESGEAVQVLIDG